ncbi:EthD family reductase [Undibacterium arcticum]
MHKLLVLYPHPDDPQSFLDYYQKYHLPLASRLPGLICSSSGRPQGFGADTPEYFSHL